MSNPMFNISYGLYVLTANDGQKDNGCIINTVTQVTSDPNQITIAVNKGNYTHDIILDTKAFTVSVISEAADFELFKHFCFRSGRDVDKFADFPAIECTSNGTLAVTKGTNAYIAGRVTKTWDVGTHTVFLADVVELKTLTDVKSATYSYYQEHIKPRTPAPSTKGKAVWRCTVCGYIYEGEELPEDFVCPLCKHGAADFEKVVS